MGKKYPVLGNSTFWSLPFCAMASFSLSSARLTILWAPRIAAVLIILDITPISLDVYINFTSVFHVIEFSLGRYVNPQRLPLLLYVVHHQFSNLRYIRLKGPHPSELLLQSFGKQLLQVRRTLDR